MDESARARVMDPEEEIDRCRSRLEEAEVRTVEFGAVDLDGLLRGKRVPVRYFLEAVARKGSAIANVLFGWDITDELIPGLEFSGSHTGYRDLVLKPDLTTVRVLPWEPETALVLCDVEHPDGSAVAVSPRRELQRQIEWARSLGFEFSIGYELEFYLFRESPESVREKDFRNLTPATPDISTYTLHRLAGIDDVVGEIRDRMNECGIPIEASNTEYGPGQLEINFHHSEPLEAADRAAVYKDGVRRIAAGHGFVASFMAKVSEDGAGSSGHIHQSLRLSGDPDANAFWEADNDCPSPALKRAVAGHLAAVRDLTAIFCPTVNSYKRCLSGSWAPTNVSWGRDNRTTALRVIDREMGSCRIEHRLPGADANPHLAIAAVIAGATHGLVNHLEPPAPVIGDGYAADLPPLPGSLADAIQALERSTIAAEAFDPSFLSHFLATRRWEYELHRKAVSDWERRRYLDRV
ncbi:MAG: glutamine synthetase family protein [Solirubrobacterales bacterium]